MADSLRLYEDTRLRSTETRKSILLFHRVYNIPQGGTALIPAKGEAVDLDGVTGEGILQPRVFSDPVRRKNGDAGWAVGLTFWQARPYA